MPEIQASFLYPFSYAPLGEGGHISGKLFGLFLGVRLSPTPSRQPLFETFAREGVQFGNPARNDSRESGHLRICKPPVAMVETPGCHSGLKSLEPWFEVLETSFQVKIATNSQKRSP